MGKVYYGEQTGLNRPCAVKVLDPRLVAGDNAAEFLARFLLEASVAAKLTHPNVVTIFDYGETPDGSCFIAMEYLEGCSLSDELKRVGRLSCDRTIHIAQQICRALREAHEHGAIHRDMKPGNVLLIKQDDDDDFVKVLDFGLVKETSPAGGVDPTQSAQVMGSPRYMAPEQVQGKAVDARTDVYALGAMMYAMLTGHPPFERSSDLATLMAQVADPAVPLTIAAPDLVLPQGLEAVVMKCLSKDPDNRYPSMEELVVALKLDPGRTAAKEIKASPFATFAARAEHPAAPKKGGSRAPMVLAICVALACAGGVVLSRRPPGPAPDLAAPLRRDPLPSQSAASAAASPRITATLHVETTPEGARVKEEGDTVCEATPCDIAYSGEGASPNFEHLLVFMKADYKLERKLVTVDISPVHVKLTKAR